jgi:hypothetical protein
MRRTVTSDPGTASRLPRRIAVACALALVALRCDALAPELFRIEVSSQWQGLTAPEPPGAGQGRVGPMRSVEITCDQAACRWGDHPIDRSAVDKFVAALSADPIKSVDLPNLQITPEWALEVVRERTSVTYRPYRDAAEKFCRDWSKVEALIRKYYRSGNLWTDDYPSISGIVEQNGRSILFRSDSQHQLMIPWQVSRGGETYPTYNAQIGRALATILPPQFEDRERIGGGHLRSWFGGAVLQVVMAEAKVSRP